MYRPAVFIFLFVFHLINATENDGSVLVLTQDNFDEAVKNNENLLVEFYAPWCGHCKALEPEYNKAAAKLAQMNSEIKLGKVDATVQTALAEKFRISGYPTLKFFRSGNPTDYSGGRKSDEIVNWLVKKTGPPAKVLESAADLKSFIDETPVSVVGYFSDAESSAAKNFLQVASAIDDHPFAVSYNKDLLSEKNVDGAKIVLYKKFDEGEAVYPGEEDPNELKKFISVESLPLIVEFNHETAPKIFGGEIKAHLLLFLSKNEGHYDKHLEPIKPLAKDYRDKLLFVAINSDEPDHARILEFFGLESSEVPTMRVIKLEDEMVKYKPDTNDLTLSHVKSFVDAFLEGTLKEHLLSQTLPEDWDKHPVKTLVATNFDEVVFDKTKDVLVEFYAPWCGHCKQLEPIYNQLGEKFQDSSDVIIAKIDATANELEHTKIPNFPTLKLYKKETNEVVDFNGDRKLEDLVKFVESRGEESGDRVPDEDEDEDVPKKDEL